MEPSTRSHAISGTSCKVSKLSKHQLSKLLATSSIFLASGSFQCTVASLFPFILHLRLLLFALHLVIKSPAEISTPIGAFLDLRSHGNLPCLVKLALSTVRYGLNITHVLSVLFKIVLFFIQPLGASALRLKQHTKFTAILFYFNYCLFVIYRLLFSSSLWLRAWVSLLGTAPCFSMQTHIKHTLFLRFQSHRIESGQPYFTFRGSGRHPTLPVTVVTAVLSDWTVCVVRG